MNMTTPEASTGTHLDEDLMTRRQVAYLFRVTSAAVASWARRGRLPEVRAQAGRPRYRRAEVEALFRRGFTRGAVMNGTSITSTRQPPAADRSRHRGPAWYLERSFQPGIPGYPGQRPSP